MRASRLRHRLHLALLGTACGLAGCASPPRSDWRSPLKPSAAVVPTAVQRMASAEPMPRTIAPTPPKVAVALPHRLPQVAEASVMSEICPVGAQVPIGEPLPESMQGDSTLRFRTVQFPTPPPGAAAISLQTLAPQSAPPRPLANVDPAPLPPPQVDGPPPAVSHAYPIDLATALALTAGQNPQVAFAQAQIGESMARWQAAHVLWLPSLRLGGNYHKHDGELQDVVGNILPVSRNSFYGGFGAGPVAAGSVPVPGLVMQFNVGNALYQPKIAASAATAQQYSATATLNDQLLETALAYLALLDALQRRAIAVETLANLESLGELTQGFAGAGQGTQADADRVAAAVALQRNRVIRAEEEVAVASARLAQQLSLDQAFCLAPQEVALIRIDLCPCDACVSDLVAIGLSNRPELAANQFLVSEALARLKREETAPWLPSLLLGASYGGFGGGQGSDVQDFGDRFDFDALAYWEVRNLGVGEHAARAEADARVAQASYRQVRVMDTVAREVVEGHARTASRARQIPVAEQGLQAAQDSYRRNLDRIRELQGLPIEALQSALALDEARREYLRTLVDYNEAQFHLHRALGWPVDSGPINAGPST